jgi:hypothetical protein
VVRAGAEMARSFVRPTTPADAPALTTLMAEAGLKPNSEPAHLDWKYWHVRADWPGPRSFVMTRGDEILAHAAVTPGACLCGAQSASVRRVRTLHMIDWAARPTATGAGVSLMKYLGQGTEALLAIGGSAQTLQLLPHLGFSSVGMATCYVRPLHPARVLTPSAHPVSKLFPRFARSVLWTLRAPSTSTSGWDVQRLESGELSRVTPVLPIPRSDMGVFERSAELFRYALACPIALMSFYTVGRSGKPRGYFVLAFVFRQARLVDCWMDSEDPADWSAMLQCAVMQAKQHPRAAELAVWASDPSFAERLRECGFHARGELPVQIYAPRNPELTSHPLRVQMLENDAAYRHSGRNELWA